MSKVVAPLPPPAGTPPAAQAPALRAHTSSSRLRLLLSAGSVAIVITGAAALIAYRLIPPPPAHPRIAADSTALVALWRSHPADAPAAQRLAAALDNAGRPADAVDVLLTTIKANPRSANLYHSIGMLYLKTGYPSYALDAFHNELTLEPKSAAGHGQCGVALFYLDKYQDAISQFKRALQLDPSDPEPYLGMGFALNAEERVQEGIAAIQRYVSLAPNPGPGYALLSRIYLNMRQYQKAVDAGKLATTRTPENVDAWYNLGEAYSYQPGVAQLPEAEKAFRQAVNRVPGYAAAHYELGWVLERMGRDKEAIAEYQQSVKYDPERGKVYAQLYKLQMRSGMRAEAAQSLAKARELMADGQRENQLLIENRHKPTDPEPLYQLGKLYTRRGKYSRAVVAYKAVLDREPGSRRAHEGLAEAYADMGNAVAARHERDILAGPATR